MNPSRFSVWRADSKAIYLTPKTVTRSLNVYQSSLSFWSKCRVKWEVKLHKEDYTTIFGSGNRNPLSRFLPLQSWIIPSDLFTALLDQLKWKNNSIYSFFGTKKERSKKGRKRLKGRYVIDPNCFHRSEDRVSSVNGPKKNLSFTNLIHEPTTFQVLWNISP